MPEPPTRAGSRTLSEGDWFDRALFAFVSRVSGRTVVITSLVLYPGVGLALPAFLGWPMPWLVAANLWGVMLAASVSVGWLLVQLEAKDRRQLLDWTTNLRRLSASEFEWFVGEVFRREGWDVQETGRQDRGDGNIDLVISKGKERRLVQTKAWTSWQVKVEHIRAFAGTLMREKMAGPQGTFVTFSDFTEPARREAKQLGITLINGRELHERAEKARRHEPCPICGSPMLLSRSQHGWWFRCTVGGCIGKRDLDREPARAVDLLTERPWTFEASADA